MWTCPACNRSFGRTGQSHVCAPAMSIDAYFAGKPAGLREIHDAVAEHLATLGPLTIEPVRVGVLFKRTRTFAELRPRRHGFALSMLFSRHETHPRITRRTDTSRSRIAHFVPLLSPNDVDDQLRDWLSESYHDSPT